MEISGLQMIIGLVIGITVLVLLILKTKIHAFLALILAATITGLIGGMPANQVVASITKGFGNTLGSIGIIIGFGVMMGRIFEVSGAAERMALTFLRIFGRGKEEVALASTGFVVSIPIFCDSGFVILSPIAKALSKKTGKSVVGLGVALAVGLVITHSLVPPTPGPLGVAGIFQVDVGSLILWGIALGIPMVAVALLYAHYIGKKIYQIPGDEPETWLRPKEMQKADEKITDVSETKKLPGTFVSFLPILLPIVLILVNTILSALKAQGIAAEIFIFLGQPIIAVALGLVIAIYGLVLKQPRSEVLEEMETGIKAAGIIILVTGGGGALGMVLRDSGVGDYIAKGIAATPLPAILLPFIIATLVRFVQGSGTVAMITSASITAPILATLSVNPVFAALAACVGSLFFSYFNDSYFWVVNRLLGITAAKEQIRVWSITSTVAWGTGIVVLLILNAIFG